MFKDRFIFFFKHRKIRFDIVTLFLSLFAFSMTFIIVFSYEKNSKSILKSSQREMDKTSSQIVEKVDDLIKNVQLLPEITAGLLQNLPYPAINHSAIHEFLLDTVKYDPIIYGFSLGLPDGSYIQVNSLKLDGQTNYIANPTKPLPSGALYSIRLIDKNKQPLMEKWEYFNSNLDLVGEEEIPNSKYDPRNRPWYIGAQNKGAFFWSDIYEYMTGSGTMTSGITISDPIYDHSGKLTYVVAIDLTVSFLKSFLDQLKIGESGEAVILSRSGNPVIPKTLSTPAVIDFSLISHAFSVFTRESKQNFSFTYLGTKYLAYFKPFPVQIGKEWLIAIVVPFNDFFGSLIHTQIIIAVFSILVLLFGSLIVIYFSKKISHPIVTLAGEIDKIRHLDLTSKLRVESNIKEIQIMDESIHALKTALTSFGRYVPKEIVKQLILKDKDLGLGGEKKEITVFVTDIENFTSISEKLPTDQLVSLLTDYFGELSQIILNNGGTIDKYIGDSIMAFWNAPLDVPDHSIKACETALRCQARLKNLNQRFKEKNQPQLFTRIGINEGIAFIGNIGTKERMNYTTIGDIVNVAHRLQKVAKDYRVSNIIGQDIYEKIKDRFLVRPIDKVEVRGKEEKISIFELVAQIEGDKDLMPTSEQLELCKEFAEAYSLFYQNDLVKAKQRFESIHQKFPDDYPTQVFLDRLTATKKSQT